MSVSVIVALDYTDPSDALNMAAKLRDHVKGFKINHTLLDYAMYFKNFDKEFFIDCKLWDTPNTVKTVVSKFIEMGATMTTVSTLNNPEVFNTLSEFNNDIEL